jgi:transcriptional regulator with XRE-family HTH domain
MTDPCTADGTMDRVQNPRRLPGEYLKKLRRSLRITTRDVEEYSHHIAQKEGNEHYRVSNAWLTQLENKTSVPSVHKLFSLSAIYKVSFAELLSVFGVHLTRVNQYQFPKTLEKTHLSQVSPSAETETVEFPIRFDAGATGVKTGLLSRMIEVWGEIPVQFIESLNLRHSHYGYIGLEDFTMYPLLRPGSLVQIDPDAKSIESGPWKFELERPIYFVELHDGYACAWCEMQERHLLLVPHTCSPMSIQRFEYPTAVEIVGRVTGVATRLVNSTVHSPERHSTLPKAT